MWRNGRKGRPGPDRFSTMEEPRGVDDNPDVTAENEKKNSPLLSRCSLVVKGLGVTHSAVSKQAILHCCTLNRQRFVALQNISFVAHPGRVLGIVGSDGSGRTTLINALGHRIPNADVCGQVFGYPYDDERRQAATPLRPVKASYSFANGADDHLLENLTVAETLAYAAALKLPGVAMKERRQRVAYILQRMRLMSCRNVRVGGPYKKGLSTGERRRLLIAIELLDTRKQIFLFDKPTEGVDNTQAREIVSLLSAIARNEKKTVVLSLYQPASGILDILDDLIVLYKGKIIWAGPSRDVTKYFETCIGESISPQVCITDVLVEMEARETTNVEKIFKELNAISTTFPKPTEGETTLHDNDATCSKTVEMTHEDRHTQQAPMPLMSVSKLEHARHEELFDSSQGQDDTRHMVDKNASHIKGNILTPVVRTQTASKAFIHFGRSIGILIKRGFLNRSRSFLCWIPALLAIFQGVLLGGIMWQYSGLIPHEPFAPFIPDDQWETTVAGDILLHGFGTDNSTGLVKRPLLEVVENGVDGRGSYPIAEAAAYKDGLLVKLAIRAVRHVHTYWSLPSRGYPPLYANVVTPPISEDVDPGTVVPCGLECEFFEPYELIPNLLATLQVTDFLWNRVDWKLVKSCWAPVICITSLLWMCPAGVTAFEWPIFSYLCTGKPPVLETSNELSLKETSRPQPLANLTTPAGYIDEWLAKIELAMESYATWDRSREIIEGLLGNLSLKEALAFVLSPDTHGDLQNVEHIEQLAVLLRAAQHFDGWVQTPVISAEQESSPVMASAAQRSNDATTSNVVASLRSLSPLINDPTPAQPSSDGLCSSSTCQTVKRSLQAIRSKVTYFLVRTLPAAVNTSWTALTTTGCLFATAAALGFFCFEALLSFHKDRIMMNRESANGTYAPSSFFIAKNILDLPTQFLIGLLTASTWGLMAGVVPSVHQFFVYVLIAALVCFCTFGFCYFISAATPRMEVALVIAPLMLLSWLILAGFILRDDTLVPIWLRWYRYISIHRYAWFSLMINTFSTDTHFGTLPTEFLKWLMGISTSLAIRDMALILLALGLGFRIFALVCLSYAYRKVGLFA